MTTPRLLRDRSGSQRVTSTELFFDLVYVFAVTQLSHHLLGDPTVRGALQSALLWAMVWLGWAYSTWVTNWMDPDQPETWRAGLSPAIWRHVSWSRLAGIATLALLAATVPVLPEIALAACAAAVVAAIAACDRVPESFWAKIPRHLHEA